MEPEHAPNQLGHWSRHPRCLRRCLAFGRLADVLGRKKVYVTVAVIMIFGAVGFRLRTRFFFLVAARLVLGFGIGGDYPVSAVYMSEYSNRQDRGRLVGLVFSMQAWV